MQVAGGWSAGGCLLAVVALASLPKIIRAPLLAGVGTSCSRSLRNPVPHPRPRLISTRARLQLEPINKADVEAALAVTKPSARLLEAKYKQFSDEFGQSGT